MKNLGPWIDNNYVSPDKFKITQILKHRENEEIHTAQPKFLKNALSLCLDF
jgi:hypothetical protein